jgi:protein-S-isoprenylcysteine O-methyltransferase Ste14
MFRWIALVVFLLALGISAFRRAQARRATGAIRRSQETTGMIVGRVVVALPLFGALAAYLVRPESMAWASLALPVWARWLGVVLGCLVVPSVYYVLTALGANVSETVLTKQQHELVTTGPYRWVRHPLYVVGIGLFLSMGLIAANWFIILWAAIAAIAIRLFVIPREEANLVAAFGDEYLRYRRRTGALLPSLRRSRRGAG